MKKMQGVAKRAYNDAYFVFKNKIKPVPRRPLDGILAWKELHDTYSGQFKKVVPALEESLKVLQDGAVLNHLDDTVMLIQRMEFVKEQAHTVLYAQLCALNKAWNDTYVTVGHDGDAVMTTDLVVGVGLRGSLDTIDDHFSGEVLCVFEKKEGEKYFGAPVMVGSVAGYLRHRGLSSTPEGKVCLMPAGKVEVLYPKLVE